MIKQIVKRDGSVEDFTASKLNKWAQWAGENLAGRVDWSMIVLHATKSLPEKVTSQELQTALINHCKQERSWPYSLMAGRLYASLVQKRICGDKIPTVKEKITQMYTDGLVRVMNYSDSDYEEIEKIINHKLDFEYPEFAIDQITSRYQIKHHVTGKEYETPQFVFMRMAMALAENRKEDKLTWVKDYYEEFSLGVINCPTPNYNNLGTNHYGLASCCLYTADDTIESLSTGDMIAYRMTAKSAGIGVNIKTRSLLDPVRNGWLQHQGKFPYIRHVETATGANLQGGRGGAATSFYSMFDPESYDLAVAPLQRTPLKNQIRGVHLAAMGNKFLAKKALNNETILLFTNWSHPELTKAFFSEDVELFEKLHDEALAKETNPTRKMPARKIVTRVMNTSDEVATHYLAFMDEINHHTPFLDPIYSSNLCVAPETEILTQEYGYKQIVTLKDKEVHVWNGEQWSKTTVKQTGKFQPVYTVIIGQDNIIRATDYHKWYVEVTDPATGEITEVEKRTLDLKSGDVLIPANIPGVQDNKAARTITVKHHIPAFSDTYCFTEPLKNRGVFNGLLLGNCVEIVQPTKPYPDVSYLFREDDHGQGEISICSLGGIIPSEIRDDAHYEKVAYLTLSMIDDCIDLNDYAFPHLRYTATRRRNAAVGLIGIAYDLAKAGVKGDTPEGLALVHRIAERHMYFLIKAALRLAKERGNAEWMHKTKWPQGWLPIDTYNKNVDELTPHVLRYDWESLRQEIIAQGGIRFSCLFANMPTESSSKAGSVPNGPYWIRELAMPKTDLNKKIDWVATDSDLLADQYTFAYETSVISQIHYYAVIQKFSDQSTSADIYKNKIKNPVAKNSDYLIEYATMAKYGIKTRYYVNSKTSESSEVIEARAQEQIKQMHAQLTTETAEAGCAGGFCTL